LPDTDTHRPLTGVRVVDLTAIWAGPLATHLLAEAGAEVDTIEAACRPDGLRGTPAMFGQLAEGKRRHDLDLRRSDARATLVDLVADADVIIESFSPRVMPNFGLDAATLVAINPEILVVSMPAFAPDTVERNWVAYGTGVHASSGLGLGEDGAAWAPSVTYPDPLAGLAAFAAICIARAASMRGRHLVVPLEAALAGLGR
ncbi:MAG: CoA transferase, partial [Acidimicrobiales bacterium]|nr:CoA transferase [Acidimicrobiales bacterium]